MASIEKIITKGKTPITCDNEKCEYKGVIYFCYNGEERSCGLYKQWERDMMMRKYMDRTPQSLKRTSGRSRNTLQGSRGKKK